MKRVLFFHAALLATSSVTAIAQFTVPVTHPTIQSAINAATSGTTISVLPGVYDERVDFLGKSITVEGVGGPSLTYIHAPPSPGPVVSFVNNEPPTALLVGFTLSFGNVADAGGGVLCVGASPTIWDCSIQDNAAMRGAGIACLGTSSPTIQLTRISGNTASKEGGGIYSVATAAPKISDCEIVGNRARLGGGLFVSENSNLELTLSTVASNVAVAPNGRGGGIYCAGNAAPLVDHSLVRDNVAEVTNNIGALGGGIHCSGASAPQIDYCQIIGNRALSVSPVFGWGRGGGIYIEQSAHPIVRSTDIAMNTDDPGGHPANSGGGVYSYSTASPDVPHFIGCTISNNVSSVAHGGISFAHPSGTGRVDNSIIWGNTQPSMQPQVATASSLVGMNACDVGGGWAGSGAFNISVDPLFVDANGGDFHLKPNSPCIDVGINTPTALPPSDIDGDPRVIGAGFFPVDIGSDEVSSEQIALAGTGDDFALRTLVNGTGNPTSWMKHASVGATLGVTMLSPSGTLSSTPTQPTAPFLLGQVYPSGGTPPVGGAIPALHLSLSSLIMIYNSPALLLPLPANGVSLAFKVPPVMFGNTLRLQAVAVLPTAPLPVTNAHEIIVP